MFETHNIMGDRRTHIHLTERSIVTGVLHCEKKMQLLPARRKVSLPHAHLSKSNLSLKAQFQTFP